MIDTRRAAPLSDDDAARLRPTERAGRITCRASGSTAIMLLYGEIGYDVTAAGVTQALATAGKADTLDIRIASIGGSVPDGWAIYNAIARHPAATKKVTVEGLAASMASIIAMAGTEIVIPENSYMMIHNPTGLVMGRATELRSLADLLEHMQGVAVQTYADRSGQQPATVQALMDAETYMSADLAVSLGFADRVEKPVAMTAKIDLSKLPSLPAQMRAALIKEISMGKTSTENTDGVDPAPSASDVPAPATDAPEHVEDGQPGALPVDAPNERRPNPPASPGYGPADPIAVAQACAEAGFPQLTLSLLQQKATMQMVTDDLARASGITEAAARFGVPKMADVAIRGGVSLDTFREMATTMKAAGQSAISTAHSGQQGASQQVKAPDSAEIYGRLNKGAKVEQKASPALDPSAIFRNLNGGAAARSH